VLADQDLVELLERVSSRSASAERFLAAHP